MLPLALGFLVAQPTPTVSSKIVSASLFKNGYAVVTREIDVPVGGTVLLEDIPQGSLGTVWLTTTDGLKLSSVKNVEVQTSTNEPAANMSELLSLNIGKLVKLDLFGQGSLDGTVASANSELVTLSNGDSTTTILANQIRSITVTHGVTAAKKGASHRALELDVKGEKAGRLYMIGLEKGLTWSPAYAIDLTDPKKLQFTAKAVLIDELGDLKDIEVRLVTGFPNIWTTGTPDPLLSSQSLDDYLRSIGQVDASNDARTRAMNMSNNFVSQAAAAPAPITGFESMDVAQEIPGQEEGDLFFYKQGHLSLSKGQRDYHILADAKLDYKEVYTWESADSVGASRGFEAYQPNQQTPPDEVWHSVEFKNEVGEPLTTGPATFFKGGELVGQDMLKYTSTKGDVLVKINKALDVRAESADEELERKRSALQIPGYGRLDLVTLRTTLKVTNRKDEPIHLRMTRPYTGELSDTGDAKVMKNIKGLRNLNPTGKLIWERDLQPGKTTSVSFTARVYVRADAEQGI